MTLSKLHHLPVYLVTLAAFFFSSSKATKYRQDVKKKLEKDFKVGGQRNWVQVLCNGGVGAFLALCHLVECGVGERAINFEKNYVVSWLGETESKMQIQNLNFDIFFRCRCDVCLCLLQR